MSPYPTAAQVSIERATEITESAFLPLRCVVEFSKAEDTFSFAIYLPDGKRTIYKEDATAIQNVPKLKVTLEIARKEVASRDISLASWVFPDA
jgi:hypothetical protein